MEEPPIIQADPTIGRKAGLGRIGLYLSLAALGALAAMWLCKPGWGSPISALGGLTVIVATPLGFLLSLIAVLFKQDRRAGVLGLILTGVTVALFVLTTFCS